MNRGKNIVTAALAATVSALALTAAGFAAPAQATPSGTAAAAAAAGVDCDGWVHNNNPDHGIAGCSNDTGRTITFRAEIVCGRAPDVSGQWVTLAPGQYGESSGVCAFYSSGVGRVGWTIQ
ncbi:MULTISPECIES: hypothetical protein [unclassified Streptomyces]|uniref:hypothetical protein n=1 Tax=unclassified Streptomyces TaxID=2593676 RepID=UPI0024417068|nr:hypothetical protein [Streptomyces sp. DH41]MDG9727763.1 hypothetical protein [Streptomyces sp. DH41]